MSQERRSLILPGVGHFAALIRALDERGFARRFWKLWAGAYCFLGICLGLQALYDSSDEAPQLAACRYSPEKSARFRLA